MKTIKSYLIPSLFGAILGVGILFSIGFLIKSEKIAFVDNGKLFNEFTLKKELEKDLQKAEVMRKARLDSAKVTLEVFTRNLGLKAKPDNDEFKKLEILRQQVQYMEEEFYTENEKMATQMNGQIWDQLNQLVKEYSEINGIDILLGTTSQGNLMYAGETYNATEDAVKFINQRYKGK